MRKAIQTTHYKDTVVDDMEELRNKISAVGGETRDVLYGLMSEGGGQLTKE
jgi:hypothetical protein